MAAKGKGGSAAAIDIFLRIRPTKARRAYGIEENEDPKEKGERIKFSVPKDLQVGEINNAKEEYNFKFGKVFDQNAKQEDIFERVAVEAVTNALATGRLDRRMTALNEQLRHEISSTVQV